LPISGERCGPAVIVAHASPSCGELSSARRQPLSSARTTRAEARGSQYPHLLAAKYHYAQSNSAKSIAGLDRCPPGRRYGRVAVEHLALRLQCWAALVGGLLGTGINLAEPLYFNGGRSDCVDDLYTDEHGGAWRAVFGGNGGIVKYSLRGHERLCRGRF
jgi:hypothetical protein